MVKAPAVACCEIRDKRKRSTTRRGKLSSAFPIGPRDDTAADDEIALVEDNGLAGRDGALGRSESHLGPAPLPGSADGRK